MKFIGHFFSQILVFTLIITTSISILTLTFFNSTQRLFSKDNMKHLVKQLDFKEIMGDRVESEIYEILEQTGLPREYVDNILENEQLKEYMGTYIVESIEFVLYEKELPIIEVDKLTQLISDSFDTIIEKLENKEIEISINLSKDEQKLIHQKIEQYVPRIADKIPNIETFIEEKISENSETQEVKKIFDNIRKYTKIVHKIYQLKPLISIITIMQIALMILLKWSQFRFLKWILLPFFIVAIVLQIAVQKCPTFVQEHYPTMLNFMKDYVSDTLKPIYQVWKTTSITCFIIVILFILLQCILFGIHLYNNRRKKDMAVL